MGIDKNLMKFNKILILMLCLIVCLSLVSAEITILHEFAGGGGATPYGSLILDSGTLYGMTKNGGNSDYGTVFSMGSDGSNFSLLHEFGGSVGDGKWPYDSLILGSGTLYGMTYYGGSVEYGTVFSIGAGGTGFSVLHEFASGANNGRRPRGSLILDSGTLYGMTLYSGLSLTDAPAFSMGTDGSDFSVLHEFGGGDDDGKSPYSSMILDSGTLYGMTYAGGDSDFGTVFSMGTDGSNFLLLHEFNGSVDDGKRPLGGLILDSGTLYGMTSNGGYSNYGTVFSIGSDGSNFSLLHNFTGGGDDGKLPYDSLILDSGKLYGMTYSGGDSDYGTVFSIGTDGLGFSLLHEFTGGVNDGMNPRGSLILDSGTFYGMTSSGGDSNFGTIFSIQIGSNEPIYSNFTSSETTNFSSVDLTNVTNLTLAITGKGKINFPLIHSINAETENYDANIIIEDEFISVNTAALDSTFNSSATITLEGVTCPVATITYKEGTFTSKEDIIAGGTNCELDGVCSNIQCSAGVLTFDVEHFTGFAAGSNANLTTEAEAGVFYLLDPIEFTAEYINSIDGTPISGECNITFDDEGTWHTMDFDSTDYNYTKSFATAGLHEYNVTCSNASFVTLEANDTKVVSSVDIPEFSTITLGLGLIAVLGGLFFIRWKK